MKRSILIILIALLLTSCNQIYNSPNKTETTKELMGTTVTITVYNEDKQLANQAIEQAFKEIERIENILSGYKNTSEVYQLNENKEIKASNELIYVLGKSLRYGDLSRGAFDITVQPILDLYKYSFLELKRPPTDQEIKQSLNSVGYEKIYIKNNNIKFTDPNTKITLGAIAKGYIIDKAIETLKQNSIEHALVNAGGDMRAIGTKLKEPWNIALQNPRNKQDYIAIIPLDNKAVATSGDYERYFDDNKEFHHIVDPRTGYSATELISVTVITDKAIDADALATSVFVLGKGEGLKLINSLENTEALIITKDKEIFKSDAFDS